VTVSFSRITLLHEVSQSVSQSVNLSVTVVAALVALEIKYLKRHHVHFMDPYNLIQDTSVTDEYITG